MNEKNGLSSPLASYASESQYHIDNSEAGPGSTQSVHAAHSPVPSCITGAQDVDEEDSEMSMLKNDVDDLNISGIDDRVEGECETGNPTSLVETAEERLQSRSDSLNNSPGKRSTTDHSFGEEATAPTTDQPHPTSTTSTASDKALVTVGEDSSTDLDGEATDIAHDKDDTATSDNMKLCTLATNASTEGESQSKRARAETLATSAQQELSCHRSRTLRSASARRPRPLSQTCISDTFKRVQVRDRNSKSANQDSSSKR